MTPLLSIGFRPLFLLASLFGAFFMLLWGLFWLEGTSLDLQSLISPTGGWVFWHAHEMLFGFGGAVVMGFLLTAVRNWTGLQTAPPVLLMLLCLAWLSARVLMLSEQLQHATQLKLLLLILPHLFCAVMIGLPIARKRMWRNAFAPCVLLILALLDMLALRQALAQEALSINVFHSTMWLFMLLVSIIGGRIIPLFTANKLGLPKQPEPSWLKLWVLAPTLALLILSASPQGFPRALQVLAAILAAAHLIRLKYWYITAIWQHPMLWSLFVFYFGLPLGLLVIVMSGGSLDSTNLHIFLLGPMAGLMLSMIARVSLGHTGRVIVHDGWILAVFGMWLFATIVRTAGPLLWGTSTALYTSSASLAAAAFALLCVRFLKVWLTPRPDQ